MNKGKFAMLGIPAEELDLLGEIANREHRSIRQQISYWIEQDLIRNKPPSALDMKGSPMNKQDIKKELDQLWDTTKRSFGDLYRRLELDSCNEDSFEHSQRPEEAV